MEFIYGFKFFVTQKFKKITFCLNKLLIDHSTISISKTGVESLLPNTTH